MLNCGGMGTWSGPALILLLVTCTAQAQSKPVGPRQLLSDAVDLYMEGRYREAADKLQPLVLTRVLKDRADQKEALRTYGISLFLHGAKVGAEQAFRDLLRLDPREELDPSFVRPEVIVFFDKIRARYRAELTTVVRKKTSRAWVNMLPPWGQFQNGHRTKAYLVLAGEATFLATNIVTAALLADWRGETGEYLGHEDQFTPLKTVNIVSFALLGALLVYGIVDGFYHYYRAPLGRDGLKVGSSGHMSGAAPPQALLRF